MADPRPYTSDARQRMNELVGSLRDNVGRVDDPRAQALFETSAEVIIGLSKAFADFERRDEPAWRS